jgi:stearoyl-CoA desaturase (delta-9 desaturase)
MEPEMKMSRAHKITNLVGVPLPVIGLIVAIILLWHKAVGPLQLIVMGVFYVLTAIGITLGYHRLFTHRSFESSRLLRGVIAVMGTLAMQGSIITWVADHRKHHAFTDQDGDPHSPHGFGPGFKGAVEGLWHAHVFPIVISGFLIPFGLGWWLGGGLGAALTTMLWAGFVRIFLLHHVTWSINSVCHFFGSRRFDVEDESRNVFWLAPFSMGEAWHHNHHAFPTSAFHGLTLSERLADPTGLLISAMEKTGLVWNVVRISPERQAAKLIGRMPAAAAPAPAKIAA